MYDTFHHKLQERKTAEAVYKEDCHYKGKDGAVYKPELVGVKDASVQNLFIGVVNHHTASV